jgi:hypothetical protein
MFVRLHQFRNYFYWRRARKIRLLSNGFWQNVCTYIGFNFALL